ncbi:MAG: glycosyltransferase family 2 protein [Promethearchaeota archaeon]
MTSSDVIVVIPAFNEEKHIIDVVSELNRYIAKDQILVANDGSTDNTLRIVRELGTKIVSIPKNQGKGFILRKSFTHIFLEIPGVKWIITFDADGQHDNHNIPHFLTAIQTRSEFGVFVGRRDFSKMPLINRISNSLTSKWCKFWLRWDINDLQCGFRCYNADSLRKILKYGLRGNKFDLETEILLTAWFLDIKLCQIPISTYYDKERRRSRITPTIDTIRWIRLVARFGFDSTFFRKMLHGRRKIRIVDLNK